MFVCNKLNATYVVKGWLVVVQLQPFHLLFFLLNFKREKGGVRSIWTYLRSNNNKQILKKTNVLLSLIHYGSSKVLSYSL